jgi:carboxylesterase type B
MVCSTIDVLLDRRLALQWIHDYIHLFGGDLSKVTLIGELAGGVSIMHYITAYGGIPPPTQKAHFQRTIMQSPAYIPFPDFPDQGLIYPQVLGNASNLISQEYNSSMSIITFAQLRSLDFKTLYLLSGVLAGTLSTAAPPSPPS